MAEPLAASAATASWPARSAGRRAVAAPSGDGAAQGGVRVLLRLEGLALLVLAVAGYAQLGAGWGGFALLFLAPDIALFGYLAGPRVGAALYNTTHSLVGPALLGGAGLAFGAPVAMAFALVWTAHIGFDRMLGYGLKYTRGFGATHLGRLGPRDAW